jgi:hypothetical protein
MNGAKVSGKGNTAGPCMPLLTHPYTQAQLNAQNPRTGGNANIYVVRPSLPLACSPCLPSRSPPPGHAFSLISSFPSSGRRQGKSSPPPLSSLPLSFPPLRLNGRPGATERMSLLPKKHFSSLMFPLQAFPHTSPLLPLWLPSPQIFPLSLRLQPPPSPLPR